MRALSIGSADIDIFISPKSSTSFVSGEETVTFNLGDKIPINVGAITLGGNAANVSVALKRLAVDSSLYTYLGTDTLSTQIRETIKKEGVTLVEDPAKKENTSLSLIFDFSSDRIIFSHHEEQNHTVVEDLIKGYEAIYLTSIGKEWAEAYKTVLNYVHSNTLALAFSPGSPQLLDLSDIIYEIIAASKILFVNKEEGEKILEKKGESAQDMKQLLQKLAVLGPHIVSVTDGKDGAYAIVDNQCYVVSSFDESQKSTDKTGAGDSYASAFFAAHILGKDIKESMKWGAVNAHSVMTKVGAQEGLLTQEGIQSILSSRPDFAVEML